MSNRIRLKVRTEPIACEQCGLKFAGDYELNMHYKHMPEEQVRACLSVRTMREVLGFYRSRGAWRLAGKDR